MERRIPPFRADHVGSLLRPADLKQAREKRERGEITAAALKEIEDQAIIRAIKRQEAIGLKSITDGEYRRAMWHFDFLERLSGVEAFQDEKGIQFKGGVATKAKGLRVVGKLGYGPQPMVEHLRFLAAHTTATPKMSIP